MAKPAEIRVAGFDELAKGSEKLFEQIGPAAGKAFDQIAQDRATVVRARVPVVSGALRASVVTESDGPMATMGIGDDGTPYAGWIEFGGTREGGRNATADRPYVPSGRYLYPTAFAAEPDLVESGQRAAQDEIRGQQWKTPKI